VLADPANPKRYIALDVLPVLPFGEDGFQESDGNLCRCGAA